MFYECLNYHCIKVTGQILDVIIYLEEITFQIAHDTHPSVLTSLGYDI